MLLFTAQALGLAALAVDSGHVAVYEPDATPNQISAALTNEGPTSVTAWPIPGWFLIELPDADSRRAEALVEHLVRAGELDFVSPVRKGLDGGPVFATPDLLVQFAAGTPESARADALASLAGFELVETRFGAMDDAVRLRASSSDARVVIAAAEALTRRADVRFAEPDCIFTGRGGSTTPVALPPNDPNFGNAWWLSNVGQTGGVTGVDLGALQAWPRFVGAPIGILAILDTGVDPLHPDLAANLLPGVDVTSDGPAGAGAPINAFDNHGTPVAGCAIAVLNNGSGASGIAPGCRGFSVRAFITVAADGSWTSATSWTINALTVAQSVGARVTNNSNTYGFTSAFIDQKYLDTRNAGLVHFASAGNAAASVVDYPASLPTVNGVGSIGSSGVRSGFSNTGPTLDFVAPGEGIYSTDRVGAPGYNNVGDFTFVNGTSFASPMTAGIALLLISADPTRTPAQIESALIGSCEDLGAPGYDVSYGNGLVNAVRALDQFCVAPMAYCVGAPNSVGPGAAMSWNGVPTACLNALTLITTGCPANGFGVYFLGNTAVQVPFGNGFRCAGGPTWRFSVVSTNSFGDATFTPNWSAMPTGFVVSPGDVRYAQFWYRDAFAVGAPFNLSNGLQITFCY